MRRANATRRLRGVLIALADQPSVSTENLAMLLREHAQTPENIVASRFGERVGAAVRVPRSVFRRSGKPERNRPARAP